MNLNPFVIEPLSCLKGEFQPPGDKSIAHRAVILSAISKGKTIIKNFPANKDCLCTVSVLKKLGIKILRDGDKVTVFGKGLYGLRKPERPIFFGDSGTTFRLLLGILAGQQFKAKLLAGKTLSLRPMLRVTKPLRQMGAFIYSKPRAQKSRLEEYPPITIRGGKLKPIKYRLPMASAQVKSAVLLAGLFAKGKTRVVERIKTRDHTERMLKLFKADLKVNENNIVIKGQRSLTTPKEIIVPGDISSASFFIVLATLLPDSKILIKNVSLNPSRAGIIRVLKRMKSDIKVTRPVGKQVTGSEPIGDVLVKSSPLEATIIKQKEAPSLIDEIPVLMVAAALAKGKSVFKGVGELRVKETDRIRSMTQNLQKMGACIEVSKERGLEKITIIGTDALTGAKLRSFGDHRTAMSSIVAGLVARNKSKIDDISCISKSFPDFFRVLISLTR
jgi:3-phosphoshikimate 1-carboxyvinyltransferase